MKKVEIEIDEKLFGDWEPVAFRIPEYGEYCAYISDVAPSIQAGRGLKPTDAEIWEEIKDE